MKALALTLAILPAAALADGGMILSDRVTDMRAGLFCAPPEGGRRDAPGTLSGWVHVPDEPVQMIADGREAPAVLGLGFGVRYRLDNTETLDLRYSVTHPPIPPTGATAQSWVGAVAPGTSDTVFFQFDTEDELQPGPWSFSASVGGQDLFTVHFIVRPPGELPGLAGLCRNGSLLSAIPSIPAAAGSTPPG